MSCEVRYEERQRGRFPEALPSAHAEGTRGGARDGHLERLVFDSEALDSDSSRERRREDGVDGTTRIVASRARARRKSARHVVAKPIDVRVVEGEPLPLESSRRRRL